MSRTAFFLLAAAAIYTIAGAAYSAIDARSDAGDAGALDQTALSAEVDTETERTTLHASAPPAAQPRDATLADDYAARAARLRHSL